MSIARIASITKAFQKMVKRLREFNDSSVITAIIIYNGNKPDVHENIIVLAVNGAGVRDTGRIMKISINTVIAHLKKLHPPKTVRNPLPSEKSNVICVMDEQWSFVGNKKNQLWLWYA